MRQTFPFTLQRADRNYVIVADLGQPDLSPEYREFFEQHGYTGNGYTWEGMVVQILEERDPELLDAVEFDPEANTFLAYVDNPETQQRFVDVLSPIFADLSILEQHVAKADRDRIDD